MTFWDEIHRYITPIVIALGGWAAGIIFERIILAKLQRLMAKIRKGNDVTIINALRGKTIYLFVLAGLYGASLGLPLKPAYLNLTYKFLQIAAIFVVTAIATSITIGLIRNYTKQESAFLPSVSIFTNLARAIVLGIGCLISLQALGISITPILTALGVGGLAVALALQDTLSNFFSGLQLIAARQFKPGDYVRLDSGEEGVVTDIAWRTTTIRLLANNLIIIPNAKLAGAVITNFQQPLPELSFPVEVFISYQNDLEKVEAVTMEVARDVVREFPGWVRGVDPVFRFNAFLETGIRIMVSFRIREFTDQFPLRHEFIKRLHQRYREEGIEFSNLVRGLVR